MEKMMENVAGQIVIRPVQHGEQVAQMLAASGLPVSDLATASSLQLFAAYSGDKLVGIVGLELYTPVALLRSLAVLPAQRCTGLGSMLVEFAELHAAALGVHTLYLLTTTAAPFFAARSYAAVAREQAPAPIAATSQFSGLCPTSSAFMAKRLDGAV